MINDCSRVLVLAYYFPPFEGGFSIRIEKFVKYLPEYGWQSVVISVNPSIYVGQNIGSAESFSKIEKVIRTNSFEKWITDIDSSPRYESSTVLRKKSWKTASILNRLKHIFLIPDRQILWFPFLILRAIKLHRTDQFDAILVTSPPMSTILGALAISWFTRLPVILDLRDDWSDTATFNAYPKFRKSIELMLERFAIRRVHHLVVPTQKSKDRYIKCIGISPKRISLIPNGYDPEDFQYLGNPTIQKKQNEPLELIHLGNLPLSRSPLTLLDALKKLLEEYPEAASLISFKQVGNVHFEFQPYFDELKYSGIAEVVPQIPHSDAIKLMINVDALVLIPSQKTPTAIPGKVYEYFASRRPIIALVEDGATKDLLLSAGVNWMVDVHDSNGIFMLLKEFIEDARIGKSAKTRVSQDFIKQFDRMYQTKELAEIFSTIVN